MAPNRRAAHNHRDSQQSLTSPPQPWFDDYGHREYQTWRAENPTHHLSYDDWKISKHVDGLALYYATLRILDESDSSDEEVELIEKKPRSRVARVQSAREPKKKVAMNGDKFLRTADSSATSSGFANPEDLSTSSKRKRKARKKYLSEEIVASDGDSPLEDNETSISVTETTTPTAPAIAINGRPKSSTRKVRRKPLSEETISPEDELDDPMAIDEAVASVVASPLPVRSAPKTPASALDSESPKKTILKLNTRKTLKKKIFSEETMFDDDTDAAGGPVDAPVMSVAKPNTNINIDSNVVVDPDKEDNASTSTASPDPANAATRRGLRTRRPAQQRPYYHDAQLFEDVEPDAGADEDSVNARPEAGSRRVSIVSFGKGGDDDLLEQLDEEAIALLSEDVEIDLIERKPKHFKGKGRAWKKEESDEDEEFTMAKKKAAKAAKAAKIKAKGKGQTTGQKKRGRPRKSVLSEDIIRDESDSNDEKPNDGSISELQTPTVSQAAPKNIKEKPRAGPLSEEIVHDDSDSATEKTLDNEGMADTPSIEVFSAGPKKRGRPRKSDQSIASKSPSCRNDDEQEHSTISYTPQGTPKSSTPKGIPAQLNAALPLVKEQDAREGVDADEHLLVGSPERPVVVSLSREKSVDGNAYEENEAKENEHE
ncbi:hypothetical protein BKA66DRAFT_324251 [Pyrenochaeta sp. MPI-SDFR-AT-0127]|nr:hypothetical protein BKA66DRAFT_324251 [Pyrenochaeta sp. MPI-SDFR-AT-0127]